MSNNRKGRCEHHKCRDPDHGGKGWADLVKHEKECCCQKNISTCHLANPEMGRLPGTLPFKRNFFQDFLSDLEPIESFSCSGIEFNSNH